MGKLNSANIAQWGLCVHVSSWISHSKAWATCVHKLNGTGQARHAAKISRVTAVSTRRMHVHTTGRAAAAAGDAALRGGWARAVAGDLCAAAL